MMWTETPSEDAVKEIMLYYARCNQSINRTMNDVIRQNIADPYDLKLDGYFFKKLGDLLDHLFSTDMIWMKAFSDIDTFGTDLVKDVAPVPAYGTRVFNNFTEYEAARTKLDQFILDYMARLDNDFFHKKVTRRMKDGKVYEKDAYKAMVHCFNHQTHHRGQVSNILDNLQIENNYSNMLYFD